MFFRDNLRMFSDGGQSYKVSFTHSDPMVTYKVTNDILTAIKNYFINSRIETIEYVRSIMVKKLESLNVTQKMAKSDVSDNALASKNPIVLRSELQKINNDISALRKQYNTSHPKIQKLKQRKKTIIAWLREFRNRRDTESGNEEAILMSNNKDVAVNISSKLYSKFYDTNMALDLEKKSVSKYIGIIHAPQLPVFPIWPKKRLFASIGLIVGFMICFIYVFIKEVMVPPADEILNQLAQELHTDSFGVFPNLPLENLKDGTYVENINSEKKSNLTL
jgi:LPS O-antigen subunit length determinant protein (WzzB/FepE family)